MYRSTLHRQFVSNLSLSQSLIDATGITRLRIKTVPAIIKRTEALRTLPLAAPTLKEHTCYMSAGTDWAWTVRRNSGQDSGHAVCICLCVCVG